MGRYSRDKGARGERAAVKLLGEWWGTVSPAPWYRTADSGRAAIDIRREGDVATMDARFPYVVEIKHVEAWSPERFLAGKASPAWDWWEQACVQAARAQQQIGLARWPMLLARRNRGDWLIAVPPKSSGGRWLERCCPDRQMTIRGIAAATKGRAAIWRDARAMLTAELAAAIYNMRV